MKSNKKKIAVTPFYTIKNITKTLNTNIHIFKWSIFKLSYMRTH